MLFQYARDYFSKISGQQREVFISRENSWFCNKISMSRVFFKFSLIIYVEFHNR